MHTEMWEHPATQANVATLRARGVHRHRAAVGRLTGADTGPGRLPEPEEIYRASAAACSPAARRRRRRPGRAPGGRQRRRHPRAARPGALPRQPLLGQAGLRAGRRGRGPRRRGHPGRGQRRRCPTPAGVDGGAGRDGPASCATPCSRRPPTPTSWSWPPPRPTSARRATPSAKIKKTHGPTDADSAPDDRARAEPRRPRRAWSPAPASGRPGDRRLRRRDRRRPARCSTTAGPSWPARAATCWWSTRSAPAWCSASTTTRVHPRRRRRRHRRAARLQGGAGRTRLGPSPHGCP